MILNIPYTFIAFSILSALLFFFFPELDTSFSALFFRDGEFYAREYLPMVLVYEVAPIVTSLFGVATILVYLFMLLKKKETLASFKRSCYAFLFLALLIGPVLIVNSVMKEFSGRARPREVVQFGGEKNFTPAFVIANQCNRNCSFVSGHSSAGFYFVSLALILKGWRRRAVFWSAIFSGGVIGLVRIIQGGHFLSDVVFSFVFVYLSSLLLHYFMFKYKKDTDEIST